MRPTVAVVVLVLAACSGGGSSITAERSDRSDRGAATRDGDRPTEGSGSEPSADEGAPASAPVTDGDPAIGPVAWSECADLIGLECGTVAVPLDHDDPDGRTIDLALARRPADGGSRIGSIVVNPGGPGGSGLEYLELANLAWPSEVTDVFDLVSFDPRGVGASSSVDCDLELDDGIELVAAGDRAAWDALLVTTQDELATCGAVPSELGSYVGTNNAARDLDLIRAALGDERLTYVGFSYGTRLGATYAELFPERVRALVLDGAVKPSTDFAELGRDQAAGFDLALGNFADACDADPDCLLRELGPTRDVLAAVRAEVRAVGSFPTDDPARVLTPGELDLGVLSALYSTDAWPFLAQAIYLADTAGDGDLFQVLADRYLGRDVDGTYSNQTEAGSFINCADDARRPPVDDVWADAEATAAASSNFDELLRAGTGCLGLPDPSDPLIIGPAAGSPPILVIGTTGDPATPYEWSVDLAEQLDAGVLYTVDGDGHTAYTSIECVAPVVNAYLVDLVVPGDGDSCADDVDTDFFVPPGESDVDLVLAFFDCLRDEGLDIGEIDVGDVLADPTGEQLFGAIDITDPDAQAAIVACRDLLSELGG